jgi:hypothetical protein
MIDFYLQKEAKQPALGRSTGMGTAKDEHRFFTGLAG